MSYYISTLYGYAKLKDSDCLTILFGSIDDEYGVVWYEFFLNEGLWNSAQRVALREINVDTLRYREMDQQLFSVFFIIPYSQS